MKQISFEQYRTLDLGIWIGVTIFFEAITTLAAIKWFYAQPIALSVTLTFVCIVMMRWGGFAVLPAFVGGFVFCLASGGLIQQYVIYCVGNMGALAVLFLLKRKLVDNIAKLSLFVVLAYIFMELSRGILSLFFGGDLMTIVVYLTTDIISLLFTLIIMILLRKADGVIEDQKTYLFRIQKEDEEPDFYEEDGGILL